MEPALLEREEHADYAQKLLFAADALLLGRRTYEGFAEAWPARSGNDEYHFWLFPVAVGRGERLFEGFDLTSLRLQDTTTFSTGIVVLVYSP